MVVPVTMPGRLSFLRLWLISHDREAETRLNGCHSGT
jgi:hypothetical protein